MQREVVGFLRQDILKRFERYVSIDTASSEKNPEQPSSKGQRVLGEMLRAELEELGLSDVEQDDFGYVYGTLPGRGSGRREILTLCAHLDTSPSEPGNGVRPVLHADYDGRVIHFADNLDLTLSPKECPELLDYQGDTVITASGRTLLGADDKAGVAAIMTLLSALARFPDLSHPEIRIVFTPDEEVGRGTENIDMARLAGFGYTVDGGRVGDLDVETFHALKAEIVFHGHNVHPGHAKGKMVNAVAIASRFVALLPEGETPEHTEGREGFFHLTGLSGDENRGEATLILRDFTPSGNARRAELLTRLKAVFETRYPGLGIELSIQEQYRNMGEVLAHAPLVVETAEQAMVRAGIDPVKKSVRGGTDGARLSFMGIPMPNLFTGGMLFHSKKEWIALSAMTKSCEVLLHICDLLTKPPEQHV